MSKAEDLATKMSRMVAITTIQRDTFDDVAAELRRLEADKAELLKALKRLRSADSTTELVLAIQSADDAIAKHGG